MKTYRALQQWQHWLREPLGARILDAEQQFLSPWLARYANTPIVLMGVSEQQVLMKRSAQSVGQTLLMTPMKSAQALPMHYQMIESVWSALPIATGSIDLVLLPHTLEYLDNPRAALTEACRVIKPEGLLIIFGFNPMSLWGLRKGWTAQNQAPWSSHFLSPHVIKQWLKWSDFELILHKNILFSPPVLSDVLNQPFKWLDWVGQKCHIPFGSIYSIVAKAKVIPLTPIKLHWKQAFSPVPPVTFPITH